MNTLFNVIIHKCKDVRGYRAECDVINGGCTVQEDTIHETQKSMFDALAFYLEDYPEISNYYVTFEVRDA